jgi:hypothetical protein
MDYRRMGHRSSPNRPDPGGKFFPVAAFIIAVVVAVFVVQGLDDLNDAAENAPKNPETGTPTAEGWQEIGEAAGESAKDGLPTPGKGFGKIVRGVRRVWDECKNEWKEEEYEYTEEEPVGE